MIKELIFSSKKWFNVDDNATEMNVNGKDYKAIPSTVIIHDGDGLRLVEEASSNSYDDARGNQEIKCIGILNGKYIGTGQVTTKGIGYGKYDLIMSDNFEPKWGG